MSSTSMGPAAELNGTACGLLADFRGLDKVEEPADDGSDPVPFLALRLRLLRFFGDFAGVVEAGFSCHRHHYVPVTVGTGGRIRSEASGGGECNRVTRKDGPACRRRVSRTRYKRGRTRRPERNPSNPVAPVASVAQKWTERFRTLPFTWFSLLSPMSAALPSILASFVVFKLSVCCATTKPSPARALRPDERA